MEVIMNDSFATLQQEVFIPVKIDTKKGRRSSIIRPDDYFANTQLAKLLAKAYSMEKKLLEDLSHTFSEFCQLNNISPRYLRGILSLNNLSPRIKRQIMKGYVPKRLSIYTMTRMRFPDLWKEQEMWFLDN
jgi:hypothetical protein